VTLKIEGQEFKVVIELCIFFLVWKIFCVNFVTLKLEDQELQKKIEKKIQTSRFFENPDISEKKHF
jgi:hypothetical protein